MRLRKETNQDKVRKMMLRAKGLSKELVTSLVDGERIIALDYKTWFEIPKVRVKVKWVRTYPSMALPFNRDIEVVTTAFFINGRKVKGWAEWNAKVLATYLSHPAPKCGSGLECVFTKKLTQVINSLVPNASRKKKLAKKVIESLYGIKVKVY